MASEAPKRLSRRRPDNSIHGKSLTSLEFDHCAFGRVAPHAVDRPQVEAAGTMGKYVYDFGDTAMTTPLIKMYTLGRSFIPAPVHAGGLRYHGMAPIVCHLLDLGANEAQAVPQNAVCEAAVMFARAEGIVPAPEPAHAIHVVIKEALACKESGEKKVIAFNLCGHGHFDMGAYDDYFADQLPDFEYAQEDVDRALAELPEVGA